MTSATAARTTAPWCQLWTLVATRSSDRMGVRNQTKCEWPHSFSAERQASGLPTAAHEYAGQAKTPEGPTGRATSGRSFRSLKMAGMAVAMTQAIKTTPKLRVKDPSSAKRAAVIQYRRGGGKR